MPERMVVERRVIAKNFILVPAEPLAESIARLLSSLAVASILQQEIAGPPVLTQPFDTALM